MDRDNFCSTFLLDNDANGFRERLGSWEVGSVLLGLPIKAYLYLSDFKI